MEQLGFLKGFQIHNVIGATREGLHNIKDKNLGAMMVELDLSKVYGQTSWLYLQLFLIPIRFSLNPIDWNMGCMMSVSFVVLIKCLASSFFTLTRGLH